ncbi:hypothetical protein RIF29_38720 [Crotalaria pallida]|uniref:Uncharacterized protein n=1 Tax=Crotalaria pallida TaxID=3830 RepID=A0AAN9E638_CROPI
MVKKARSVSQALDDAVLLRELQKIHEAMRYSRAAPKIMTTLKRIDACPEKVHEEEKVMPKEPGEMSIEGVQNHAGEEGDDVSPGRLINEANNDSNQVISITDSSPSDKCTDFSLWMLAKKPYRNKTRVNSLKKRMSPLINHEDSVPSSRFSALLSDTEGDLGNVKEILGGAPHENKAESEDCSKQVGRSQNGKGPVPSIPKNNKVRNNLGGKNPQNKNKNDTFRNKPTSPMMRHNELTPAVGSTSAPVSTSSTIKANVIAKENEKAILRRMKELPATNLKFMDFLDAHSVHINKEAVEFVVQARNIAEGSMNPKPPDKVENNAHKSNMVIDLTNSTLQVQTKSMIDEIAVGNVAAPGQF